MNYLFTRVLLGCCLLLSACGSPDNGNTSRPVQSVTDNGAASSQKIATKADLQRLVDGNKNVLVDFYADWCGPCKQMMPAIDNITRQYKDQVVVARINVDDAAELCEDMGIEAIPHIIFYKEGKIKNELEGYQREEVLKQNIAAIFQ